MKDAWQIEAEAANKTISRIARQSSIYRKALETVANSATLARPVAELALAEAKKIDEELWK